MFQRLLLLSTLFFSLPGAAIAADCIGLEGEAGDFQVTIVSNDIERMYNLHVPASYSGLTYTPLLFNFHGLGDTGMGQAERSLMIEKSDEEGFIVIHPEGIGNSWNAGETCCGEALRDDIDDVQFARDMVAATASRYCTDADRLFSTGFSNGGYMSHRLGCEASDLFAAIAPASGLMDLDDCNPPRPVPVVQDQGTNDLLVSYDAAVESNNFWKTHNQCQDSYTTVYNKRGATCIAYNGCLREAVVEFCTIKRMTHIWPTEENTQGRFDATDTFWDFFEMHPFGE